MKVKDVTRYLESLAPKGSQESYDNSGLLVGNQDEEISGVLACLDCTEEVVDEAISLGANLIIAHHPIIFKGLKAINGKNYVERTVIKAIQNDICIYAIHTNLDNYNKGVNFEIGNRLGLKNLRVLDPKPGNLVKLVIFCPDEDVNEVSQAIFEAGAGEIGNYRECSFETSGTGYFRPTDKANPTIGKSGGERESVSEKKIEAICSTHKLSSVLNAMNSAHPYEEVAHDIYPLKNFNQEEGAGMIGELDGERDLVSYLEIIKKEFNCGVVKYTKAPIRKVKKVAFCGGAGSFLVHKAKAEKADLYITGDMKYHEFFDGEDQIVIADIGHYESEQFTPNLINSLLRENFTTFAVHLSKVNTNPINYL